MKKNPGLKEAARPERLASREAVNVDDDAMNYVQTLLHASQMAIVTFKASGPVVWANEAVAKLVGTAIEDVKEQNFRELDSWKKIGFFEIAERVLATGREELFEGAVATRYRDVFWVTAKFVPFRFEGESHFMIIAEDITERKNAEEEALRQKKALEQKNAAIKEILEQIQVEKQAILDNVTANVNEILLPLVNKLKRTGSSGKQIDRLRQGIEELTSSFGRKISQKNLKLSPREIEICNLIKAGSSSKEIADLLSLSVQTISKHRAHIRHKLGLDTRGSNLISYLQGL